MQDLETLRYPIGQFDYGKTVEPDETRQALEAIAALPHKLTALVGKWGDDQLDTPYRPEGWTARQLVHHVADSHINAYVRTKLMLTEDNPTIKPYEEGEWAKLPDSTLDVATSLVILSNLHARWVTILASLTNEQLRRTYYHPGMQKTFLVSEVMNLYAWHGEHHYQHVYRLAERSGWL
ncbi:YfiT family bacillithiol transferase [Spirosoma sp. KUDC1026]|uniref:YfiT family bacillithiol transferase n=1 Tax=Spirosoma sp. KUDC1026 TaxID=2745947 RepID=UPI00159BAB39|nr:putative metal-dependent hydrolase [Spirosoma sp. KUDC1026]QKZ13458.1 putative metal-dependent hydrolase [Spirosoma sp. KUDC1026]